MNSRFFRFSILAAAALVLVGCNSPAFQTGPDAEVTHDGLTRVNYTTMDKVWARTDIDLSGYDKIVMVGTGIQYRPVKDSAATRTRTILNSGDMNFPITDKQKAKLSETFAQAFLKELSKSQKFTLTDELGPGVLLVRGELLDVASAVPPPTIGRSDIYLTTVGEATLVLEVYDGDSGAILARAIDQRAAESSTGMIRGDSVSTWVEVNRLANFWARRLREGLDSLATPPVDAG